MNTMFLAIDWVGVGLMASQLLLSLSILVILHEFGHYITARWFKCRVEKFYLFFDPWFSLFKKKIGDTVYGIGWLPLGGYVKISGMMDESMDKEQLKQPPQPWEFRSKPAWQRLIVMLGGVTVNILLAFFIYAMILIVWGEKRIYNQSMKYGIEVQDSLMLKMGFRDGDKLIGVDDKIIDNYYKFIPQLIVANSATVERNGQRVRLQLEEDFLGQLIEKRRNDVPLLGIRYPFWVGGAMDTGVAIKLGVQRWDKLVSIDSVATPFFTDAVKIMEEKRGRTVNVVLERKGQLINMAWPLDSSGIVSGMKWLGKPESLDSAGVYDYEVKKYSFFPAFPAGVKLGIDNLVWYKEQFKKILTPSTGAYKGMGGFKSMARVFDSDKWDWERFWTMTALFSVILAFMNLLPIPGLDGGHVLFTLVEMITGRKPSDKFLEYAQIVGFVIVLALMLYANGNDWFGWGKGK